MLVFTEIVGDDEFNEIRTENNQHTTRIPMKNIVKTNSIKVRKPDKPDTIQNIETSLGMVLGVDDVKASEKGNRVKVRYNLKFINYKGLEKKLQDLGCTPVNGIFSSIRRGFINFTEKTEIESLKIDLRSDHLGHIGHRSH